MMAHSLDEWAEAVAHLLDGWVEAASHPVYEWVEAARPDYARIAELEHAEHAARRRDGAASTYLPHQDERVQAACADPDCAPERGDATVIELRPGATAPEPYDEPDTPEVHVTAAVAEPDTAPGPPAAPERDELPPLLPEWARSWPALRAHGYARVRRTWHRLRWHLLRSPIYAARLAWQIIVGTFIGIGLALRWLTAAEYGPLVGAAREKKDWEAQRDHILDRGAVVKSRFQIAGTFTIVICGGLGLAAMFIGRWILYVLTALVLVTAAATGRRRIETTLLDTPTLPTRIDMNMPLLDGAFRATGLLKGRDDDENAPRLQQVSPVIRDGKGWAVTFDLPRGNGKTAADALAKRDAIAAELGVDEIQVHMARVRAHAGGHAGRISMWVADDDPYIGEPNPSPLARAEQVSIWDPIPFGQDARGTRVALSLVFQSMFFGGLPRRGKTFSQRLVSAAGVLDPYVRHYVADGKGGSDWAPMRAVAHRLVVGAEDDALDALKAMLRELIAEMEQRFAKFRTLPPSICPESKITPEICRRYNMPIMLVTIDELQEYFVALDKDDREKVIDQLCRIARRGPAAGFVPNFASQRPDAESVPPKLRDIITYRYCTQVIDRRSSDMVLGAGKAVQGADASILAEEHKGVGVLVTGPASFTIVRCDYMDGPAFIEVCGRGRKLRQDAGTLTGDAAGDLLAIAADEGRIIPPVLSDVLSVMQNSPRIHTADLLARLVNLDEETYGDFDADRLAAELDAAGVRRTMRQVKIDGVNLSGWLRSDLDAAADAYVRMEG